LESHEINQGIIRKKIEAKEGVTSSSVIIGAMNSKTFILSAIGFTNMNE
jgi:hypothetical protein